MCLPSVRFLEENWWRGRSLEVNGDGSGVVLSGSRGVRGPSKQVPVKTGVFTGLLI